MPAVVVPGQLYLLIGPSFQLTDPEFMDGVRRGLEDRKLGRVESWTEVRQEFGL